MAWLKPTHLGIRCEVGLKDYLATAAAEAGLSVSAMASEILSKWAAERKASASPGTWAAFKAEMEKNGLRQEDRFAPDGSQSMQKLLESLKQIVSVYDVAAQTLEAVKPRAKGKS